MTARELERLLDLLLRLSEETEPGEGLQRDWISLIRSYVYDKLEEEA